jgi:hypothetical protein
VKRAIIAVAALALVTASVAQGAAPTVQAAAFPSDPLFGDTFAYVVEVHIDASKAGRVRIGTDVGPFTRVVPTRTSRSVSNGVARITVTQKIACLAARCIPGAQGKAVALPRALVTVDGVGTSAQPILVQIRTRVADAEVRASKPVFRRPATLPPATVRVDPVLAQAALVALFVAGLVGIAAPLRRRRPGAGPARRPDPVARAVRLLRESATRDTPDRRRAASLVSRVVGEADLAAAAARVAWSRGDPGPPDAAALADRVDRTTGGGA